MTRYRLFALGFFFIAAFAVVLFRAGSLQLFPHDRVESLARRQLEHRVEIVARRGTVSDRNGNELAVSTNSLSIYANPKLVQNVSLVASVLSRVLEQPESMILNRISEAHQKKFIWLARQLDRQQLSRLNAIDLKTLVGIGVLPEFRREFPQKHLASHILGFVSIDGAGLAGIERRFQKDLVGEKTSILLSHDALGRPVFSRREQIRLDLDHGSDVELTLDSRLQYSAERALQEAVEFHDAEGGSAIVMDPYNGEILAMANYPGFDPNVASEFEQEKRRNRALSDPIEPGSVLKPFVVARALEDKLVKPESVIPTFGGKIKVGRKTIGEADAKHRFEAVSVVDLIRLSSNVATVVLKDKIGWARVEDTYRRLGFGTLTGVELPGESRGIFVSPKPGQILEQATMSFGQGISLTQVQLAQAYAVIANGGVRVRPHLVKRIVESTESTEDLKNVSRVGEKPERVFSQATSEKLREILEKVVEGEGTGVLAKVDGFRVAGKTGTSQRVDYRKGGYEHGAYWSSFAGFIPSEKPRFVITVMVDHPRRNGYFGGVVAAPAFSKIAQVAMRMSRPTPLPLQNPQVLSRKAKEFEYEKAQDAVDDLKKPVIQVLQDKNQIPSVVGMPLTDALRLLQSRGLEVQIVSTTGRAKNVFGQLPVGGSPIDPQKKSQKTVYLKLR